MVAGFCFGCYTITTMDKIHDVLHSLINHIIPHEGNDYRPHLLQKAAFVGMMSLILLSFLATNVQALLWQSSQWLVGAVLPAVIVDLTNTQRNDLALPTLQRNSVLDAAAKLKADNMAAGHYFSHDSPTGVTPWHWFDAAGYTYAFAGENLAVYFTDSDAVVDAWMKSPTHRANIVGKNYTEIGVGTAKGTYNGYDTVFVVQLFGTPALKPVVPVTKVVAVAEPAPTVVPPESATAKSLLIANNVPTNPAVTPTPTTVLAQAQTSEPLVAGESVTVTPEISSKPVVKPQIAKTEPVVTKVATPEPLAENTLTENSEVVPVENSPAIEVTDANYVAVYSDFAATSTNLTPILATNGQKINVKSVSPLAEVATQPNKVLQFLYIIVGAFVVLTLLLSVLIEWREHRPVQTAYGVGLLMVMICLFYIHSIVTAGALVL